MNTRFVLAIAGLLLVSGASAAPAIGTSLSVKLLADDNLYLQNPAPLIAGETIVGSPSNEFATGVDLGAVLTAGWKRRASDSIELGYAPDVVRYPGHASEDHTDHVLTANAATAGSGWSAEIKTRVAAIDGGTDAPIYNALGGTPAIGGEPVRARRAQSIVRVAGKIFRDAPAGFVRGVFAASDQDFRVRERAIVGYCNYADRSEDSAGLEGGWRAWRNVALVASARVGRQRQQNILGAPINFSNTFTRWLAGVEGSPLPALKLAALFGPDIRHYGTSVRSGFSREQRTTYGEASATWTPTKTDTVALTAKRYLWLSSGGRGAYADLVLNLSWRRRMGTGWSASVAGNYHEGDTGHFNPWSPRHDRICTGTLGIGRAFAANTRVDLEFIGDWATSLVPNTPARAYQRSIVTLGVARRW